MKKTLEEYRKEIDSVDEELLNVIAKRFALVRKIGELKKEKNISPLDEKRWQQVMKNITDKTKKLNISEKLVIKIYEEIHKAALAIEKGNE